MEMTNKFWSRGAWEDARHWNAVREHDALHNKAPAMIASDSTPDSPE